MPTSAKPQSSPGTILIVDDELDILHSLKSLFEFSIKGVKVETAESGDAALAILGEKRIDLILSDFKMPGMNGLEFLEKAATIAPGVPRILITAFPDVDIAIKAINEANIENFITKPFDPQRVTDVAEKVLKDRRAKAMRDQNMARSFDVLRRKKKQS
jgi:DNA-binding NtrC family response regulator